MCEQPNAIEGEAPADWRQTQRLNPMKERFAERELIDAWGRRAVIALVHETRVVYPVAEARMGFKTHAIRQINGVR